MYCLNTVLYFIIAKLKPACYVVERKDNVRLGISIFIVFLGFRGYYTLEMELFCRI